MNEGLETLGAIATDQRAVRAINFFADAMLECDCRGLADFQSAKKRMLSLDEIISQTSFWRETVDFVEYGFEEEDAAVLNAFIQRGFFSLPRTPTTATSTLFPRPERSACGMTTT